MANMKSTGRLLGITTPEVTTLSMEFNGETEPVFTGTVKLRFSEVDCRRMEAGVLAKLMVEPPLLVIFTVML